MGTPVDHLIPGSGGTGLKPIPGRFGPGPVREGDRNAEDILDIRCAGGILEPGPEAETVGMELSITDTEHHIAPDHRLAGHRDIEPDLQTDIPRLSESISPQGHQQTNKKQLRFHKRPSNPQKAYPPQANRLNTRSVGYRKICG